MLQDALAIAVLTTLTYCDIFDYPLTSEEIFNRLIKGEFRGPSRQKFLKILQQHSEIKFFQGYYYLSGRKKIIQLRQQRTKWSNRKWQEVETIKQILQRIPLIVNVYVTGSLAMNNVASPNDDIDLLVVTRAGTLWIARLWVMWLIMPLGKYRRFASKGENAWCFNLWLEENDLTMPSDFRSLYAAYEVLQAKSIYEDKNQLILANDWINEYIFYSNKFKIKRTYSAVNFPEARAGSKWSKPAFAADLNIVSYASLKVYSIWILLSMLKLLNLICYVAQRIYMWPHQTRERVGWGYAFFHPRDTRGWIESELDERIKKYSR